MNELLTLAFLFFIGAVAGWGLEVLYRRFLSPANPGRRWINPGFCTGPWLPLYGFGLCILYLLSDLARYELFGDPLWDRIALFLLMAVCMTAIEYTAGILCLKLAKVRLWDYSRSWGNIQGIVCPAFSAIWGALGVAYFFLMHPHIRQAVAWLGENLAFSFVIGLFYGVFLVDLGHSTRIITRMRQFAREHDVIVRFEDVKLHIRQFRERTGQKVHFLFPFRSELALAEHLKAAREAWEEHKEKQRNP